MAVGLRSSGGEGEGEGQFGWLVTYLVDIGMQLAGRVPCLEEIGMCLGGWRERLRGRGPCRMGIRLGGHATYLGLVCSACLPRDAAGEARKGVSGSRGIKALWAHVCVFSVHVLNFNTWSCAIDSEFLLLEMWLLLCM